jgi:hypothetical protein
MVSETASLYTWGIAAGIDRLRGCTLTASRARRNCRKELRDTSGLVNLQVVVGLGEDEQLGRGCRLVDHASDAAVQVGILVPPDEVPDAALSHASFRSRSCPLCCCI